jgi:hypothetical protein
LLVIKGITETKDLEKKKELEKLEREGLSASKLAVKAETSAAAEALVQAPEL